MLRERLLFVKEFLENKLVKKPKIFWATIYPTYACNYRCKHCYGKYGESYGTHQVPETTLDIEQVEFLVRKLDRYGCHYLALLGGEPLLHKDIQQITTMVKDFAIELSVITNGSLVKNKLDSIKNISTLTFSVDGNEEPNDFLRGKGAYNRSFQALEETRKYQMNQHINVTLYKKSIENIDGLFEYAKKNRIYVGFCPLMYQSYLDTDDVYLWPSDKDYRAFYTKVIALKKQGYPILYSAETYKTMLNWPDFDKVILWNNDPLDIQDLNFPPCFAGQHYLYIGANGDMYPCSQLVNTEAFSPKNVFTDGFEEAWQHAQRIPCKACTNIGFLEINMLLSFRLKTFLAMAHQSFKELVYNIMK